MNVLEKNEIKIIGSQLGIFARPHVTYATGMLSPVLANGLSNGWK
jgi:hypothetical protein